MRVVPSPRFRAIRSCCKSLFGGPEMGWGQAESAVFRGPKRAETDVAVAPGEAAVSNVKIGKIKQHRFPPVFRRNPIGFRRFSIVSRRFTPCFCIARSPYVHKTYVSKKGTGERGRDKCGMRSAERGVHGDGHDRRAHAGAQRLQGQALTLTWGPGTAKAQQQPRRLTPRRGERRGLGNGNGHHIRAHAQPQGRKGMGEETEALALPSSCLRAYPNNPSSARGRRSRPKPAVATAPSQGGLLG